MDGSTGPSLDSAANRATPDIDLGMVGASPVMRRLRREIRQFAPLPAPVLVTGDTGTGKELVALALHRESTRKTGPFVALNAAALPATLIASELFGHLRGAFTGAVAEHRGVFQQAHGGTLFLDEVGELPLDLQAWLLRVLETGEVRPLGAERSRKVDVRVIAATNLDLERAVRERRFRPDLYWRLAVLTVAVPTLAARKDDLAALAEHFIQSLDLDEPRSLTAEALQLLALHDWPGNVRELRSVLVRAAAISPRTRLDAEDIARAIGSKLGRSPAPDSFAAAFAATGGNMSAAARLLGIPRTTFRDRIRSRGTAPLN